MAIGLRGGFTVDYSIKGFFLDTRTIEGAARKGSEKALAKAGAYLRNAGRWQLRRRKTPSMPGQSPSVRSKDSVATLRNILYGVDPAGPSMVCGPVGLHAKDFADGNITAGAVPGVLEFGGTLGILEKFRPFNREGAIRAFGTRANQYVEEFGVLPEWVARDIYKQDFAKRVDRDLGGIWVPASRKRRNRYLTRVRTAKYAARPFMGPALDKSREKLPLLWAASLGA